MKNKAVIVLCAVSISLSLAALCISFFRCEPITMDWMGVLVGVLSFLVTILLGWQIFTLLDIQKIQREVKRKDEDIYKRSEKNLAETHMALWAFYLTNMTEGDIAENSHYGFVQSGVATIVHFSRCGDYAKADSVASRLIQFLPKLKIQEPSGEFFDTCLKSLVSAVESPNKIPKFEELLSALCKARQQCGQVCP